MTERNTQSSLTLQEKMDDNKHDSVIFQNFGKYDMKNAKCHEYIN